MIREPQKLTPFERRFFNEFSYYYVIGTLFVFGVFCGVNFVFLRCESASIAQMSQYREQLRGICLSSDSCMKLKDWGEKWLNEHT